MYLNLVLLLIFIACLAFLYNQGLWSNAIMLVNVITGALITLNYYEPLADWLDRMEGSYTYAWDFLSLWLLFAVSVGTMRTLTDQLSKVKVKFRAPVNQAGGLILAGWIGWVMICFTLTTLHAAPLSRNFMEGAFQPKPDSKMFFGMAPDHQMLAFMQRMSLGAFSRSAPKANPQAHVFDPQSQYIFNYAQRRDNFSRQIEFRVLTGS